MFKMPCAGKYHAHAFGVAVFDAVFVFDRASGLDHRIDAYFVGDLHAICKREERVARHHTSFQVEAERLRFGDSLP